jgi:hypothetical protein
LKWRKLTAEELARIIPGSELMYLDNAEGEIQSVYFGADGHATGTAKLKHGTRFHDGTWRLDSGVVCRQFPRSHSGAEECSPIEEDIVTGEYRDMRTGRAFSLHLASQ